ncbi:S-layer protein [Candidatus Pacearchaeota archaeon]|nr:S-layer protein [Candidatus Pacearchaeota archaeon]
MHIVQKKENELFSLPCKELPPSSFKALASPLAQRLVRKLAEKPSYAKRIAEELDVHEQKIYYHMRMLEQARIISPLKTEARQGAIAQYYELAQPSFAVRFKDFEATQKIATYSNESEFLEPFIHNGELKALVVVGSPDPHGPEKARARDGYYGIDLALFLGTFLHGVRGLNVRLDTEIHDEDLKNNLIILGGPIVNNVARKINKKLPLQFKGKVIVSTLTKKEYYTDETGIIIKMANPFDKTKKILLIAGRRHAGTRACILAFTKHFKEITDKKQVPFARVIEGIDLDSDGIVDDVEIRE